jgi:NAD(P)-dependent dehydrogenase (short-subunit alcohol dehydrogenase family)
MLVKLGHDVSVIARRPAEGQMPSVRYWEVDLLDHKRIHKVLRGIIRQNGRLNNLIFFQRFRDNGDDWRGELETSLTATKQIIEGLVNDFDNSDEKSIVIISSAASHFIAEEQPLSYHVAKAGLNQLVRYYAFMFGAKGIRVNSVSPAIILKEEAKEFYRKNKPLEDLYKRITPLGRMGTSEDVAGAVSFLCGSNAAFITGQNIIVDGGLSLQCQDGLARKLSSLSRINFKQQPAGNKFKKIKSKV